MPFPLQSPEARPLSALRPIWRFAPRGAANGRVPRKTDPVPEKLIRALPLLTKRRAAVSRATHAAANVVADTRNIIRDAANLVREIKISPQIGLHVSAYLLPSALLLLIGTILLCLTTIQWLIWLFPGQPAWAAYGEVTLTVLFAGLALGLVARKRMKGFDFLKQTSAELLQDVTSVVDHAGDTVAAARDTLRRPPH